MPLPLRTLLQQQEEEPSPISSNATASSIMITAIIIATAITLSASLYLILRVLRRKSSSSSSSSSSSTPTQTSLPTHTSHPSRITPETKKNPLIETLPIIPFHSLSSPTSPSPDCAICLSKFEQKDFLRLLPLCCHAFHQSCIDTWLDNNFTCPLCRSPVLYLDDGGFTSSQSHSLSSSSRSFRIELGNVSRRQQQPQQQQPSDHSSEIRRSYSLSDSFNYVVHDDPHDVIPVPTSSFRRQSTEFKVDDVEEQQHYGSLAAEVGTRGGGGWLKDYLSHSLSSASSRTASFRGSARWFFTGSGRRNINMNTNTNTTSLGGGDVDLEGRHFGEEIGELFRWLSGV